MHQMGFFPEQFCFSPSVAGLLSSSRLRGTQATGVHTTVQVWVPSVLRAVCPGRSNSRNLANSRGEGFRPARDKQVHGNPEVSYCHFFTTAACRIFSSTTTSPRRLGEHGTTPTLQVFPFVTATSGCCCVCEHACACVYPTTVETERSGAILALFFNHYTTCFCCVLVQASHCCCKLLAFGVRVASMVHAAVAVLQSIFFVTQLRTVLLYLCVCVLLWRIVNTQRAGP